MDKDAPPAERMDHSAGGSAPTLVDTAIRAALAAVPYVGGPLEVIYSDIRARQAAKADQVVGSIVSQVGEERLLARIAEDPELEALFVAAVNAALRTGIPAKRRLLTKCAASALLDDASFDEAQLVVDALDQLEGPHVVALARMQNEWQAAVQQGEPGWGTSEVWQALPSPVKGTLVRVGAAIPTPTTFHASLTPTRQEGISDFGLRILDELRQEGYTPRSTH